MRKNLAFVDWQGHLFVKLYDTVVLHKFPDGLVLMDTGGNNTRSTCKAINYGLEKIGSDFRAKMHKNKVVLVTYDGVKEFDTFNQLSILATV